MARVKLLDPTDARRRLDRYELIGEIASGGMAIVFLGRLGGVGGFQRFVAIKRLHPHLACEPEFVEMFLDEARLAAGIHHPNVVPILEVGTTDAGYYLVMEYIEGDTLARLVARALSRDRSGDEREALPRPIVLRVILDALAGLHAAHELCDASGSLLGLVHRDVSPQNILVGIDGSSRLTDFGVARATARLSTTRAGQLKGKLAYMAPEQTRGTPFDRRADLFSMGTVLWELLVGQRLFKTDSQAATLSRILLDPIPAPSCAGVDVPRAFDGVCARALARDPAQRYQTAAEMAEGLERAAIAAARPSEIPVASLRDVAGYVQRVIGHEISQQRETVRAWLAQSEPSLTGIPVPARSDDRSAQPSSPPAPPSPGGSGTIGQDVTGKYALDTCSPLVDGAAPIPAAQRGAARPHDEATPSPSTTRGVGPRSAGEHDPLSSRTLPGVFFPAVALPPPTAPPPPPTAPRVVPDSPPIPTLATPAPPTAASPRPGAEDGEPTAVRGSMTLPQPEPVGLTPADPPLISPRRRRESRAPFALALLAFLAALAVTFLWLRGVRPPSSAAAGSSPPSSAAAGSNQRQPSSDDSSAPAAGVAGPSDVGPATATAPPEPIGIPVSALPAAPPEPKARRGGKAPAPAASGRTRHAPEEDLVNPYR